ncbi:Multidrug transporter EmrE [compost metagenome]|jgi:small multidrug resistance pump|uniref:DMT family transporter n=1 Tax=Pseudomonas sp. BF-B-30 TaxID=2832388 RepID=UPI000F932B47|nr:SMR family transporter [Pseudomonas sp. BF-B-30]
MNGHLALAIAICMEVIATSALASIQGLTKPLPLLAVIIGYVSSFYMLAIVVKTIPIGIAYAIWSGMGIVLVTLVSVVIYRQKPDMAAIVGMGMIVAGVVTIQLFSSMKPH